MTEESIRSTIVVTIAWAAIALAAQLSYVLLLVPRLPAAYPIHLAPRPYGAENLWETDRLVGIGWAFSLGIIVIATLTSIALRRGDRAGGLGGALVVAIAAPLVAALQLSNAVVETAELSSSLPLLLVLVALAVGIASFVGLRPRGRAKR